MLKLFIGVVILIFANFVLVLKNWSNDTLRVISCDVGQGDATLVTKDEFQMLIDAGKDDSVLECLDKYIPTWDRTIELVVVTHPDLDHFGGISEVFSRYRVGSIGMLPIEKKNTEFRMFQQLLQIKKEESMHVFMPVAGQELITNETLQVRVLSPLKESVIAGIMHYQRTEQLLWDEDRVEIDTGLNPNDLSIVLKITYKEISFLFAGDIEKKGELALLSQGLMSNIDVLKVGHHGSKTSSTAEFLQVNSPEVSIISAGRNNTYGHPEQSVITRLEEYSGKNIFRTDQEGTIELQTDGYHIWKI